LITTVFEFTKFCVSCSEIETLVMNHSLPPPSQTRPNRIGIYALQLRPYLILSNQLLNEFLEVANNVVAQKVAKGTLDKEKIRCFGGLRYLASTTEPGYYRLV